MNRRIINTIFAIVVLVVSQSCRQDMYERVPGPTVGFRGDGIRVEVSPFDEQYAISVTKSGTGNNAATVNLKVDPAVLEEYNKTNDTDYLPLDPIYYDFINAPLAIGENEIYGVSILTWSEKNLAKVPYGHEYAIPIRISNAEGAEIKDGRDKLVITFTNPTLSVDNALTGKVYVTSDIPANPVAEYTSYIQINMPTPNFDVDIDLAVDNSLVDVFNKTYNAKAIKPAVAAPNGLVSVPSTVTLNGGDNRVAVTFSLDYTKFFDSNGDFVYFDEYVVPLVITGISDKNFIVADKMMFLHLICSEEKPVEPVGPEREIKGPWTVIEGGDICIAKEKLTGSYASWDNVPSHTVEALVDGDLTTEWWSLWEHENSFPIAFVFDMGQAHLFKKLYMADGFRYQGQYRKYRFSIAKSYKGADTKWIEIASGERGYEWQDKVNVYECPVTIEQSGRYLKFEILEASWHDGDYINSRGRLTEIYGYGK